MTPHHYLFDTPQGQSKLNAIGDRLRANLGKSRDPLVRAAAYFENYQERYVEPGLERLHGPDGVYHFKDAALYIHWAASEFVGAGEAHSRPESRRPLEALMYISKGYGGRYMPGMKGLRSALVESGATARGLEVFDGQCQDFADTFETQLQAAGIVNSKGQNPQAVADVIEMFAQQLYCACDWMESTRQHFTAHGVRRDLDEALERLHNPPDYGDKPPRRKKKKSWR